MPAKITGYTVDMGTPIPISTVDMGTATPISTVDMGTPIPISTVDMGTPTYTKFLCCVVALQSQLFFTIIKIDGWTPATLGL